MRFVDAVKWIEIHEEQELERKKVKLTNILGMLKELDRGMKTKSIILQGAIRSLEKFRDQEL